MNMNISVDFDFSEFKDYCDDTLEAAIRDEIKHEVLRKVKSSPEYQAIVKEREAIMMSRLDEI